MRLFGIRLLVATGNIPKTNHRRVLACGFAGLVLKLGVVSSRGDLILGAGRHSAGTVWPKKRMLCLSITKDSAALAVGPARRDGCPPLATYVRRIVSTMRRTRSQLPSGVALSGVTMQSAGHARRRNVLGVDEAVSKVHLIPEFDTGSRLTVSNGVTKEHRISERRFCVELGIIQCDNNCQQCGGDGVSTMDAKRN